MKGGRCTSSSAAPPPFIPSSAVFPSSGPHLPLPQSPGHPKRDPCSQRPARLARFHHRRCPASEPHAVHVYVAHLPPCFPPRLHPMPYRRSPPFPSVRPLRRPDADVGHTMRSAVRRWESLHGRACMLQSEILTAVVEGEVQIWVHTADSRASDMERGDVAVLDDGRRGETVSLPGANKRAASRNEPDRTLPLFLASSLLLPRTFHHRYLS
ncbi:hypothetical protein BD310DRAFT_822591 [Dichomitus squalens]|uniref:Uncharacterized protein n=1 Tax=Dichomitus squalens TaxID=114155 RepID=A0A4Q9PRL9_9APHY|nr:hypothetical protein BD310DRAFT_822591 [Dichomitus squalens]